MGVLQQQQHVADPTGATVFDECPLQRERVLVRDAPEPPDLQGFHRAAGSNVSICFLTTDMNWSATAPSISRWS